MQGGEERERGGRERKRKRKRGVSIIQMQHLLISS